MSHNQPPITFLPILRRVIFASIFAFLFLSAVEVHAQETSTLSGRITNSRNEPIDTAFPVLFPVDDPVNAAVYNGTGPDDNGEYILTDIVSGTYRLRFIHIPLTYHGEYYDNQLTFDTATPITITAGSVLTGFDAVLGDAGQIVGTVVDGEGVPVADVDVTSYYLHYVNQNGYYEPADTATTDSNGHFAIAIGSIAEHVLEFVPRGELLPEFYADKLSQEDATHLTLAAGETMTITVELNRRHTISGVVSDIHGTPLPDISVALHKKEYGSWEYSYPREKRTDANGFYSFDDLGHGEYRIGFQSGLFFGEFYDNQQWVDNYSDAFENAETIQLFGDAEQITANATLNRKGVVRGQITDIYGVPLESIWVNAYAEKNGEWEVVAGNNSRSGGAYGIRFDQPNGTYRLRFSHWGYVEEFYDDVATVEAAQSIAIVADSEVTGIDVVLRQPDQVEAGFSATPRTGESPLSVIFSNEARGEVLKSTWNFGDGATSTEISPTHTYTTPGVYTVTLTVAGAENRHTVTRTNYISLTEAPITEVNIQGGNAGGTPQNNPKVGETIYFSATATGSNVQFLWDFGDDSVSAATTATGQYVQHSYAAPGDYTVTLTARNGVDEEVRTLQVAVQEAEQPTEEVPVSALALHAPSTARIGESILMSATVGAGENVVYSWDFGDDTTATGDQVEHTYSAAGTYTVSLTANNDVSEEVATTQITVQAGEEPVSALALHAPNAARVNESIVLSATVGAGDNVTYSWDFGDDTTATGKQVEHAYGAAGTYTVTLTASNGQGDEQVTSQIVVQHGVLLPNVTRAE